LFITLATLAVSAYADDKPIVLARSSRTPENPHSPGNKNAEA